jgi:hypothetical protein
LKGKNSNKISPNMKKLEEIFFFFFFCWIINYSTIMNKWKKPVAI